MERRLREELDSLKPLLCDMAANVGEIIERAVDGLRQRDLDRLEEVIRSDTEVDLKELEADQACISLLALHQPVARGLRLTLRPFKQPGEPGAVASTEAVRPAEVSSGTRRLQ